MPKPKTTYECVYCGQEFPSEQEALDCEWRHDRPKTYKFIYRKPSMYYPLDVNIPIKMEVTFDSGRVVLYTKEEETVCRENK